MTIISTMHVLTGIISCAIILGCLAIIIVPALRDAWAVIKQPIIVSNDNTPHNSSVADMLADELPSPREQARINRRLSPISCSKEA